MPKTNTFIQPTGPQPLPPNGGGKEGYTIRTPAPPGGMDPGGFKHKMGGGKKMGKTGGKY